MSGEHRTRSPMINRGPMGGGPGAMGAPGQKVKNFKQTLKRLVEYLLPQKIKFIAVFILAIGSAIFSIVGPKIMGMVTTMLSEGVRAQIAYQSNPQATNFQNGTFFDMQDIRRILLLLLGLYILSSLLSYVTNYMMAGVAQKTVFDMRSDIKDKLDKLPLKYYDTKTHGEILSRATNDMDTIAATLQQSLTQLITSFVTITGILVMMLSINPIMTAISLVTLPLSFFCTLQIAKNSQKFFASQQKIIGEMNGHVEEMFTGHKAVKVFGYENESIKTFDAINERYFDAGWKAQFISGLIFPALNFISNLGYVLVCIVGGVLVAKKLVSIGDIQAFIQYMRHFTMPVMQTANIANIIQSTLAAAERVFEILDEQEETPESANPVALTDIEGNVSFQRVKFGYKPNEELIKDISINVGAGSTVAIVGPTGAGKTTLVNLLMRFYEINEGGIFIDGINIMDMRKGDLRKIFGMVLQDTWLFNGTIFDNIKYSNEQATDGKVYSVAKAAHADHFIRALPDGYNTLLNEEASNISQGQKQLLTIARALLTNPPILILDEATSNVDTRTEVLIQSAMDKLMEGRTSFVIAHRLSTIKNADLILVMEQGAIIEQGTHKQLMAAKGSYAGLYNSQFSD